MSYEAGSYIDLRHINKPHAEQVQAAPKRRTTRCSRQHVDEAIERFTYKLVGSRFVKVRHIQVAYA
jgi:hypothetical protein